MYPYVHDAFLQINNKYGILAMPFVATDKRILQRKAKLSATNRNKELNNLGENDCCFTSLFQDIDTRLLQATNIMFYVKPSVKITSMPTNLRVQAAPVMSIFSTQQNLVIPPKVPVQEPPAQAKRLLIKPSAFREASPPSAPGEPRKHSMAALRKPSTSLTVGLKNKLETIDFVLVTFATTMNVMESVAMEMNDVLGPTYAMKYFGLT